MRLAAALEHTWLYRMWQAPFAERKLAPVLAHNDLRRARLVLDVACGPGTNTHHFRDVDYIGVDLSERYIAAARRRHGRTYVVADVGACPLTGERFDFILANSFLHHVDTPTAERILSHLAALLTVDGHVHVLDLVLPHDRSVARWLARLDRGTHARSLPDWWQLLTRRFEPVVFEPYALAWCGVTLWSMVYFKGRARRSAA